LDASLEDRARGRESPFSGVVVVVMVAAASSFSFRCSGAVDAD